MAFGFRVPLRVPKRVTIRVPVPIVVTKMVPNRVLGSLVWRSQEDLWNLGASSQCRLQDFHGPWGSESKLAVWPLAWFLDVLESRGASRAI